MSSIILEGLIPAITVDTFQEHVLDSADKVMVEFWAPWCNPSELQGIILEKQIKDKGITGKIYRCNTEECADITKRFDIQAIPSIAIFQKGQMVEHFIGIQPANILREKMANEVSTVETTVS